MFNDTPRVSVITTVYKNRYTLNDAVLSVITQDYPNIQYIIVDDGPNSVCDTDIDKLVSHSTLKPIIIHNKENLGISAALNEAMNLAEGEYIFNLADDDIFYDSQVISDWVHEFLISKANVIYARYAAYSQDLCTEQFIGPTEQIVTNVCNLNSQDLFELCAGHNIILGCSVAKKRTFIDLIGGYDTKYRLIEDYPMILRTLRNGERIHFFDRIVIKHRVGGISAPKNIDKAYFLESDEIFKIEILPYVNSKFKAYKKYIQWKRNIKKIQRIEQGGNND